MKVAIDQQVAHADSPEGKAEASAAAARQQQFRRGLRGTTPPFVADPKARSEPMRKRNIFRPSPQADTESSRMTSEISIYVELRVSSRATKSSRRSARNTPRCRGTVPRISSFDSTQLRARIKSSLNACHDMVQPFKNWRSARS